MRGVQTSLRRRLAPSQNCPAGSRLKTAWTSHTIAVVPDHSSITAPDAGLVTYPPNSFGKPSLILEGMVRVRRTAKRAGLSNELRFGAGPSTSGGA
jgi:hypothetical protein